MCTGVRVGGKGRGLRCGSGESKSGGVGGSGDDSIVELFISGDDLW